VNMVMNLEVPKNVKFLSSCRSGDITRRAQLDEVKTVYIRWNAYVYTLLQFSFEKDFPFSLHFFPPLIFHLHNLYEKLF
jgi:hypothetical protein